MENLEKFFQQLQALICIFAIYFDSKEMAFVGYFFCHFDLVKAEISA